MSEDVLRAQADLFKALGHPVRVAIVQLLADGERCVCDITPTVATEQPTVSRHLSVLRKEAVLSSRKQGLHVYYRIRDPRVLELLELSTDILKGHWQEKQALLG